ncbi:MAG: AAA family ATPase [Planctomycetota bacterium]|nr:MAG: AAA family ATPase [Planctomycetota bacterium]GDY09544.1 DNA helicase [Planctomycetia bacterium]
MDDLSKLNAAQRDAVSTLSGPLLVLAGAGTGKTRVITFRIANLIRSGIDPERILSVTFTNKAAKEMQERALTLLSGPSGCKPKRKPWISTFHSFCVRVLRQDIESLGYPKNFTIYDRGDQESAARRALRDLRIGEKQMRPGDLVNRISQWKSQGVLATEASEFVEHDGDVVAAMGYKKYQSILKSSGSVDFDDLLLLTNRLFEEHPDVLEKHQRRFDHVQIDEYQDTNGSQFDLIEALVRPHLNLCVVGDDDQSIYGWRGADIAHILGFPTVFPGTKVVRLQENYRCTEQIIDLANSLVKHNRNRHDKQLIASRTLPGSVRYREYENEELEAETVVREIDFNLRHERAKADDFAILFRTNEQPRVFEVQLRRFKVPYVLLGERSFFDNKEVRDLLAYLRVISQPLDEQSLLRIINTPARNIGDTSVEKILSRAVQQKVRFFEAVPELREAKDLTPKTADAVESFATLLTDFRRRFDESPKHMAETFHSLLETIDYDLEIQRQYKEPEQQLGRQNTVEQLIDTVKDYVANTDEPTLSGFLDNITLSDRDSESDKDEQLKQRGVRLMTIHAAKGLEFNRVYLVGLEEGLLPHRRSVEAQDATPQGIDEERRLCYVGVTRAKDSLTLTRAQFRKKWGKLRESIPSRFLNEMFDESIVAAMEPPDDFEAGAES